MDYSASFLEWICECDFFKNNKVFFNRTQAEDNNLQIVSSQVYRNEDKEYCDGSVEHKVRFTVNCYQSISANQLVKSDIENNENVSDLASLSEIINFVKERNKSQIYPNFGENFEVQQIYCDYNTPSTPIFDSSAEPILAIYSIPIVCEVIEYG